MAMIVMLEGLPVNRCVRWLLLNYREVEKLLAGLRYLLILIVVHGITVDRNQSSVVLLWNQLWHERLLSEVEGLTILLVDVTRFEWTPLLFKFFFFD